MRRVAQLLVRWGRWEECRGAGNRKYCRANATRCRTSRERTTKWEISMIYLLVIEERMPVTKPSILKDLLEPYYKGRISFDRENLTGKFNVQLIERIDHVKDFLLVIGKNSLCYDDKDRSNESVDFYNELTSLSQEDFAKRINILGFEANIDYVRIEIGRALRRSDLHIIPIVPERSESFNFASLNLPSDIAGIKNYEAVFYSDSPDALFKDIVPKVRKHLKSKPNLMLPKKALGMLCLVMIMFLVCVIYMSIDSFS